MTRRSRGRLQITLSVAVLALLVLGAQPASAFRFEASFAGTFRITFGSGPGGTDELFFSGTGSGTHVGVARIDGYSTPGTAAPAASGSRRIG